MALAVTAAELRSKQLPAGSVDPNIKAPRHVREQAERAEALQRAANGESEPVVLPPEVTSAGPTEVTSAPAPTAPTEAPTIQPAPEPAPPTPPTVDWERQFHSLKGRFDQIAEQVTQVTERLQMTEAENRRLKAGTPPPLTSAPGPAPLELPPGVLTEQEIADYGPDFVDMLKRVSTAIAAPLQGEIARLQGQVGQVAEVTANASVERLNATMEGLVPGWQAVNHDPKFIQWSGLPDVFSGVTRRTLMQEAWNAGDAKRLAAFFRAYSAEEAALDPSRSGVVQRVMPQTVVTPIPSPQAVAPASPVLPASQPGMTLEHLAAPGRAHSAAEPPAGKPIYSSADITRFYADGAAGRWRGREAQYNAIDADIILAGREGRIMSDQRFALPNDPRVTSR